MRDLSEAPGLTLVTSLFYNPNQSVSDIKLGLESFKTNDVNIIFVWGSRDIAKVICAAEEVGLFNGDHVWHLWSWVWPHTMENLPVHCTAEQIKNLQKSDGLFALEPSPKSVSGDKIDVGITSEHLFQEIQDQIRDDYENSTNLAPTYYDLYVYDSVWVVAYSIHDLINETGQNLFDAFFESSKTNVFNGLSGKIGFGSGPHTLWPQYPLKQLKSFESEATLALGSIDDLEFIENISWVKGEQPRDHNVNRNFRNAFVWRAIDLRVAICVDILSGFFILVSIFCIFVNNFYRKKKMIKITSPVINNVILTGVILVVSSVFMGSYLGFGHDPGVYLILCYTKTMVLSFGFTLGFGGLFCKTWRVYRVMSSKNMKEKVTISDLALLGKIGLMVAFDVIYLVFKVLFVPYFVNVDVVALDWEFNTGDEHDTKIHWRLLACESENEVLEIFLSSAKFLLVIFGVFLSYETKGVHIDELNDSKTIALSIYNFVICFVFGALTIYTAGESQVTLNFVLQSAVVLYCAAVLVGTHFLPRQIKVIRSPLDADDVNIRKTTPSSQVATMSKNKL